MKKFSKEWFENKLTRINKQINGYGKKRTATKGFKPDLNISKKEQRLKALYDLAKEKGISLKYVK